MNNEAEELLQFLNSSPTAFHAAAELKKELRQSGYKELDPSQRWNLKEGGKYFLSRNKSAVIAFNADLKKLTLAICFLRYLF